MIAWVSAGFTGFLPPSQTCMLEPDQGSGNRSGVGFCFVAVRRCCFFFFFFIDRKASAVSAHRPPCYLVVCWGPRSPAASKCWHRHLALKGAWALKKTVVWSSRRINFVKNRRFILCWWTVSVAAVCLDSLGLEQVQLAVTASSSPYWICLHEARVQKRPSPLWSNTQQAASHQT